MTLNMLFYLLKVGLFVSVVTGQSSHYAMYVWQDGWDTQISGCDDINRFLDWSLTDECFTHSWNTADKRKWLWNTCNHPGRQVDQLFFYDTKFLSDRQCSSSEVLLLKETLIEGRQQVPGLKFYALYSDGGVSVPEKDRISHVVWYNTQCAQNAEERLDGVAVNNEDYSRYWTEAQVVAYLDNLDVIREEAHKQDPPGSLVAHYSVSWIWGKDDDMQDIMVTWRGQRKPVMQHFIDIFDSLDVQVAFIFADVMEERLRGAEWDYAQQLGKEMLPTIYLNKAEPCQITFFPFREDDPDCASWSHPYKSEAAMFAELDTLQASMPGVRPVLHYFRGPYSSGGHPDWPKHD